MVGGGSFRPEVDIDFRLPIKLVKSNRMNFQSQNYGLTMGFNVGRDGMLLELFVEGDVACAEAFYSDETHIFSLALFKNPLPMEVVAWPIGEALKRLTERHTNIVTSN